jgi:hypothetical protein
VSKGRNFWAYVHFATVKQMKPHVTLCAIQSVFELPGSYMDTAIYAINI